MPASPLTSVLPAVALVALLCGSAGAEEPLVSNRPGFSNTWEIVQPGRVELNAGVQFGRVEDAEILSVGQVLVRAGLSERLEFRVGLNSWVDLSTPGADASGLEDPSLGLKIKLFDGAGGVGAGRPEAALILQTSVPVGSDELGANEPQPAGILVLAWDPRPGVHLDTNHGVTYVDAGSERFAEAFASYGLALAVAGDLGLYVEAAAFEPLEGGIGGRSFLFAALTYVTSPRMQLDLGVGRGLNRADPDHFVSAGVAYRW